MFKSGSFIIGKGCRDRIICGFDHDDNLSKVGRVNQSTNCGPISVWVSHIYRYGDGYGGCANLGYHKSDIKPYYAHVS